MKRSIIIALVLLAAHFARADLRIADVPVELRIDQVSERMIRVELSPIDEKGQVKPTPPSTVLVPFETTERLVVRDLPAPRNIPAGRLRVRIHASPLTIGLTRPDGKLVQELIIDE